MIYLGKGRFFSFIKGKDFEASISGIQVCLAALSNVFIPGLRVSIQMQKLCASATIVQILILILNSVFFP